MPHLPHHHHHPESSSCKIDSPSSPITTLHLLSRHAIFKRIKSPSHPLVLVDYGCGQGNTSRGILDLAKIAGVRIGRIIGLDEDQGMVNMYNKHSEETMAPMEAHLIGKEESSLEHIVKSIAGIADYVFSSHAIHLLPNPQETIRILSSTLKSGGKIILVDYERNEGEVWEFWMKAVWNAKKKGGGMEVEGRSRGIHHGPHSLESDLSHLHHSYRPPLDDEITPGFNSSQARSLFSTAVGMESFFYERAYELDIRMEEDKRLGMREMILRGFVAGMTRG